MSSKTVAQRRASANRVAERVRSAAAVAGLAVLAGWLPTKGARVAAQASPVNATTFHYDSQRTGWNPNETILTPDTVSSPQFGPLWNSPPLDSVTIGGTVFPPHLYATPLYVDTIQITRGDYAGQTFSVVFAATSNDDVFGVFNPTC